MCLPHDIGNAFSVFFSWFLHSIQIVLNLDPTALITSTSVVAVEWTLGVMDPLVIKGIYN